MNSKRLETLANVSTILVSFLLTAVLVLSHPLTVMRCEPADIVSDVSTADEATGELVGGARQFGLSITIPF